MLTGTTGFIGSHIAERLIQNNIITHLFVRRRNRLIDSYEKKGAIIYVAQPDNLEILKESVKNADTIIHCAGATKALKKKGYISANVEFTRNLLNLVNKKQRFVFISSQAAAGPSNLSIPSDEETEPNPVSYYGKSKLLAENSIKEWGRENHNNFVILRPCVVYGPGEKDIYNYFKLIKKGILLLLGNGNKRFSIIHVEDLVSAVMTCAGHSSGGETYFISNDEASSWKELSLDIQTALNKKNLFKLNIPVFLAYLVACLSDTLSQVTKKPSMINCQKILDVKQSVWLCSNSKIKKNLLWEPEISLKEGIRQTADWYSKEKWI